MSDFVVVSAYTRNSGYEKEVENLIKSCKHVGLKETDICGYETRGNWEANCQYKAEFLKEKLDLHKKPVVWVDADAVFREYPKLFHELTCDLAAHKRAPRQGRPIELLSGTLFFNHTDNAKRIIDQWIATNKTSPKVWDQKTLQKVVEQNEGKLNFELLPPEYCKIFDLMKKQVENPVIEHFQASRKYKRPKRKVDPAQRRKPAQPKLPRKTAAQRAQERRRQQVQRRQNKVTPNPDAKVIFPAKTTQRYWDIHYKYVHDILKGVGPVELRTITSDTPGGFKVCIEGKWCVFDFGDSGNHVNKHEFPVFKFHYRKEHEKLDGVYPFLPVCFYNWKHLDLPITYRATGDRVLNCQRPYANALQRRKKLRTILKQYNVDWRVKIPQVDYWKKINDCLVSVFVPGQNNNMLDRAHTQFLAFGCCTISPNLPEILPYNNSLIPDTHYIKCADDYSDLTAKIDWCKEHRDKCLEIGNNAKLLFRKNLTQPKLIEWIKQNIS
jgi:hypothetical protein